MTRPVAKSYMALLDALGRAMRSVVDPTLASAKRRRQFADPMMNDLMALPGPRPARSPAADAPVVRPHSIVGA